MPINFSRKSQVALDFAIRLTQGRHTALTLFHVFDHVRSNFRELDKLNEELADRMRLMVVEALGRARQRGWAPTVEDVHQRVGHGKATREILTMAQAVNPDILVMGAPTSRSLRKFVPEVMCTLVLVRDHDQVGWNG